MFRLSITQLYRQYYHVGTAVSANLDSTHCEDGHNTKTVYAKLILAEDSE